MSDADPYAALPDADPYAALPDAKEAPPDNGFDSLARQYNAGQYGSLTLGTAAAAARAAGHPLDVDAPPPQTWPQTAARAAGGLVGGTVDLGAALLTGGAAPETMAGLRAALAARPLVGSALAGATYGAGASTASQYAKKGQVDPVEMTWDTAGAAALGFLPNVLRGAHNVYDPLKRMVGAIRGRLAGDSAPLAAAANAGVEGDIGRAGAAARDARGAATTAGGSLGEPAAPEAGLQTQADVAGRAKELAKARTDATKQLYADAAAEANQYKPDFAKIRAELTSKTPTVTAAQQQQLNHIADNIEKLWTEPVGEGPTGLVNPDGSPLSLDEGSPELEGPPSPYKSVVEYQRSLRKLEKSAARSGDSAMASAAAKGAAVIDAELDIMSMGKHGEAQAEYKRLSEPINRIMDTPGGDLVKLHDHIKGLREPDLLHGFQTNPEKVWPALFGEGKRGAVLAKEALGARAEPAVRGQVAKDVQDMSAADLRGYAGTHATFLREFPETQALLHDYENKLGDSERVGAQAQQEVESAAARQLPVKPEHATAAIKALIKDGNTERLGQIVQDARRGGAGPNVGRRAVAQYYREQLTNTFEGHGRETDISKGLATLVEDWDSKQARLVEAGVLSRYHADSIGSVMRDMDRLSRSIVPDTKGGYSAAKTSFFKRLAAFTAIKFGGLEGYAAVEGAFGAKPVMDAYRRQVHLVLDDVIRDPVLADELKANLRYAKNPAQRDAMLLGIFAYRPVHSTEDTTDAQAPTP